MTPAENYNDIYITEITINKVRHLENISIKIADDCKKHLIITGKNGSGKTSLLLQLQMFIDQQHYLKVNDFKTKQIAIIDECSSKILSSKNDEAANILKINIENALEKLKNTAAYLHIHNSSLINDSLTHGKLIIDFEQFSRVNKQEKVDGPKNIEIRDIKQPITVLSTVFSQYLTNQRMSLLNAREDNNMVEYQNLKNWFANIESIFREVYEDEGLTLHFKNETKVFEIVLSNREAFTIENMSAGFAAYFKIITELLLRMEFLGAGNYNIPGICFIDEIETHLHVDLQGKALPMLTKFFPNIQFIVTTHSPFVVNSLSNAVVFDLENKTRIEDPSKYSTEVISKVYFKANKFSAELKDKLNRLEKLVDLKDKTNENRSEIDRLMEYVETIPTMLDPEIKSKILDIKLKAILDD